MYRPTIQQNNNVYSFILMKNRFEELAEIPVGYVQSIKFSMGKFMSEPTVVNISIPSVIQRDGQAIEQPLYNMIKTKMQIVMNLNGKKYLLDIKDVEENETKNYSIKNITAYECHNRLTDIDAIINTGSIATRQLYRPENERVEIADGMLNIFEQQCTGWKVGTITEKARKELIMCKVTNTVYLQSIDKIVTDTIFNENVYIDIGNKPLYLKLNIFNEVYDLDGKKYMESTSTFELDPLPYPISNIKATYVSTDKHFYGIEITVTHANGHVTTQQFDYVNCKNLRLVADINIVYENGDLRKQWTTKYRTFESSGSKWYTLLEYIAQSFDCIFIVDSFNQTINAYHYTEFGEETGISLLYDNAIKETTRKRDVSDLVTRLWVNSSNTTIAGINVLGTDYLECYDYFKNEGIMSQDLVNALDTYDLLLAEKDVEFNNIILQKHTADQNVTLYSTQVTALEERIDGAKALLTAYIKDAADNPADNTFKARQQQQQAVVTQLENDLVTTQANLQRWTDESTRLQQKIIQIGIDIKKDNAQYNGVKIFNDDLLLELADYLIEKAIEDDTYVTSYSLYAYAQEQIKKYQKLNIDFSITSSTEFIKRSGYVVTDCFFLGAKMVVEDRAGLMGGQDGTVLIYAFELDPNKNEISGLKFTNSAEAPDTPLKSISRTTQTTRTVKSLTDFYKGTWKDMKDKALDIEEILTQGLDLSAQKVRSRSEENVLDISEAGIFCIDANNNNEQLAIMNDLITMTTDGWRTSKVAISPEGVMADTIIGRLLMGNELYISNADTSFHIDDIGLKVKDRNGTQKLFMGLYNQQPWFLVGDTNSNYLQWWNNRLTIRAEQIQLGSSSVATQNDINNVNGNVSGVKNELVSMIEVNKQEVKLYVDNKTTSVLAQLELKDSQIRAYVNDRAAGLQSQITVNANSINSKVSKGSVVSEINQSAEGIKINANKIDLNGTVTVTGNSRYIKIEDANYSVFDGNIRKGYLGFRGVSGTDYVVPKFVLSATNTDGTQHEQFVVTPYKGNGENPQRYAYGYVDIAYHTNHYSASTGGDWSNVKMYADGVMRVSPIQKLEITSNFSGGSYKGGGERLVAEFRTDNHGWYNGNISVGAVVNRTNGNGLILIDQHDHLGRQTGVRVQCNDDGGHSFRPLTNGECYLGTSNYRWKTIYSKNGTIQTSDIRYKSVLEDINAQDCYDVVEQLPIIGYASLTKTKEECTSEEILQAAQDNVNVNMGISAQDMADTNLAKYVLTKESGIYGVNLYSYMTMIMGALQHEITLRKELEKRIEELEKE